MIRLATIASYLLGVVHASYVAGAVCSGTDTVTAPPAQMLAGRHLKIYDYVWPGDCDAS